MNITVSVRVETFKPQHLEGILELCSAQGWSSFPDDPARALRSLTSPGSVAVVATAGRRVLGFCQVLSDGEIQACCTAILVAPDQRRRGLGRRLLAEGLRCSGALRLDLLADADAVPFYRSLPHRSYPGFRIYPIPKR